MHLKEETEGPEKERSLSSFRERQPHQRIGYRGSRGKSSRSLRCIGFQRKQSFSGLLWCTFDKTTTGRGLFYTLRKVGCVIPGRFSEHGARARITPGVLGQIKSPGAWPGRIRDEARVAWLG